MHFRVKEFRMEKKISQEELSKKANVSRTIISGLENGTIKTTSTDTLRRIADALEKKVSDIFLD